MDTLGLNKEQEKKLEEYIAIKRHIKACFDMNKFLDIMKECIDNSEHFEFNSERSRKFINKQRPIFILKSSLTEGVTLRDKTESEVDEFTNMIVKHLSDEILNKISDNMMNILSDPEKYHDLCNVDKDLVDLVITNIYKVNIDKDKGIIHLEYFDF